jgi:hypothetical protein
LTFVNQPALNQDVGRVMAMTASSRALICAAAMLGLAACGSSDRVSFETEGLRAPSSACQVRPSAIGLAEKIRDIDEGNGCEVNNAWLVHGLGEVAFSAPATMNCGLADPLSQWLEEEVQESAAERFGERVVGLEVAASYSCRPRNNRNGARMSEHGYGNAIDISAFTLASGRKVSVAEGWRGARGERAFLHDIHEAACGEFHTVLGPGADRHHHDHIHLDLQNRASGSHYCQ